MDSKLEPFAAMGPRMRASLRHALTLAGIASFALALWVLHEALPPDSYRQLADAFGALPGARLAAALAITVAGYAVLTGYDLLALRHLGERVPLRDAAGAASELLRRTSIRGGMSESMLEADFSGSRLRVDAERPRRRRYQPKSRTGPRTQWCQR